MNILPRTRWRFTTPERWHVTGFIAACTLVLLSRLACAQSGSLAELLACAEVPRIKSWSTLQTAGNDRLGGFYDSGNFLRVDPGRRYVLLDTTGPGVVDRMWFTYKGAFGTEPYELLVYLDRTDESTIRANLDELFRGQRPPFVAPLAGLCGDPNHPGRYSYVPLGFRSSCRIVLQPTASADKYQYRTNSAGETIPHIYYQITYRQLADGTPVRSFDWELSPGEADALQRIRHRWSRCGEAPREVAARKDVDITVPARGTAQIVSLSGGGTITALRLQTEHPESLALKFTWDGAPQPAVVSPLGPFFACADGRAPNGTVGGVWCGYRQGEYYSFLPMPYRASAVLEVVSHGDEPIRVIGSVDYQCEPPHPLDGSLHVFRYDYNPPPRNEDYLVLDAQGQGHFVGLVMDRPGNMEGDDRFYVDGAESPVLHGTGTEDFFNFAWGLSHVGSNPLHGITAQEAGPCCYRWHLPAAVPFHRSLRITWEHGHDERQGANQDQRRYSGVAFYYLLEGTPRCGG